MRINFVLFLFRNAKIELIRKNVDEKVYKLKHQMKWHQIRFSLVETVRMTIFVPIFTFFFRAKELV